MASLYEFLHQADKLQPLNPAAQDQSPSVLEISNRVESGVTSLVTTNLMPSNGAERFAHEVANFVSNDGFLRDLSDSVQRPNLGETEDEFVERCNQSLLRLASKHLKSS